MEQHQMHEVFQNQTIEILQDQLSYMVSAIKWVGALVLVVGGWMGKMIYNMYKDNKTDQNNRITRLETREDNLAIIIEANTETLKQTNEIMESL